MDWKRAEAMLADAANNLLQKAHSDLPPSLSPELQALLPGYPTQQPSPRAVLTDEGRQLLTLQRNDMAAALGTCAKASLEISGHKATIQKLLTGGYPTVPEKARLVLVDAAREKITAARETVAQAAEKSPEAFLAVHSRELRMWRRQLETGRLVITPFVREQIDEVSKHLMNGRVVFLHGETGTGKTELARLAAVEATGRAPELVRGYAGMDSRELFGHMELTAKRFAEVSEIPKHIETAVEKWGRENPSANEAQKTTATQQLTQAILNERQVTVSEYVLGAVYRAARDGVTVILDEANYIPPPLLAKLNDILTKRPGESITVQEDGVGPITVKKGFSLVLTGNIDQNAIGKKRYGHRFEIDPAHHDRVVLLEHNYLPQAVAGQPMDHLVKDKQLYAVVLTSLLAPRLPMRMQSSEREQLQPRLEDRIGSMVLPGGEGALDTLWRLTQLAAVTQRAFAGKIANTDSFAFQKNGAQVGLQTDVALSPRRLMNILKEWRDDGFERPLDYYLKKRLIDQALKPEQREYLTQLAQKFGFTPENPPEKQGEIEVVPGRAVFQALFGAIPERTVWPDGASAVVNEQQSAAQMIAAQAEAEAAVEAARKALEEFKDLFSNPSPVTTTTA